MATILMIFLRINFPNFISWRRKIFFRGAGAPYGGGPCAMARLAPWLIRPCVQDVTVFLRLYAASRHGTGQCCKQNQIRKTRTKTNFFGLRPVCPKTDGFRPHHWKWKNFNECKNSSVQNW